jgi:hypothetical protein
MSEIYHHGILGMKWGVRRYQNKDGSLTPAGKKRVAKMKDEYTALTGKKLIRKPTPKNSKTSNQNGENTNKKKSIKEMSDAELRDKINRLQMEKQAKGLESDLSSKGEKFVSTVGKQVIAPAAIDAGRRLLTDALMKIGKEKLGLNLEEAKDALGALKKEVDEIELKKRKAVAEDYFNKREKKQENNKTDNSKKESKTEDIDFEFVSNKSTNKSSRVKEDVVIDAEYEEVGETIFDRYKDLRLPAPR